jgi:hypothetical protein
MSGISKQIVIESSVEPVYKYFTDSFNDWWPREYTWSQDQLEKISLGKKTGDLCTEVGPNGFRIDWGTVTQYRQNEVFAMKWQIGMKRDPIPDLSKGSDVVVTFKGESSRTIIRFEHFNFKNHGDGWEEYEKMMDSEYGWDYILEKFRHYCESSD